MATALCKVVEQTRNLSRGYRVNSWAGLFKAEVKITQD